MKKHNLIVIEGLDGSGKGTQTALLRERILSEGHAVRHISFPNYAASSFYAVDRYAAYKKHWESDYLDGVNILADRYTTSNAVYQMTKLPQEKWDDFLQWLRDYEYGLLELPSPDVVLYLDIPPQVSQRLMSGRYSGDESRKDIHETSLAFQEQCRRSALYSADQLGWQVIACSDGEKPRRIEDISREIWRAVCGSLI